MRTIKALASELAKREGKKSQARIGDIREILGHLSDIVHADKKSELQLENMLDKNGKRRAKIKPKKASK
jgi:hypothetical protein